MINWLWWHHMVNLEWHCRWHNLVIQSLTVLKLRLIFFWKIILFSLFYLFTLKAYKVLLLLECFHISCRSLSFCQTHSSEAFVWLHSPSRPKCSPPLLSKHFPPLNLPGLVWLSNSHIPMTPRVDSVWHFISSWEENRCQSWSPETGGRCSLIFL